MNLQLPIKFVKNRLFQTCIITKCTCLSIFSKIGLVDQSKPCTQVYLQKFANCINLQLAIRISKNDAFRTCTTPLRTFMLILRSIGLLDIKIPRKEIISMDGRTIGSFFLKMKKNTKIFVHTVLTDLLDQGGGGPRPPPWDLKSKKKRSSSPLLKFSFYVCIEHRCTHLSLNIPYGIT